MLVFAACATVGCFDPGDDEPTRSDTSGSGLDSSSGGAESTSSADASTEATDAESSSGDPSATSSSSTTDTDATTGEVIECGDGIAHVSEECDDGNDEDADACNNACVAGFYTGTLEPCSEYGETMCGYFEAECRRDPDAGELAQLCYWPQGSPEDACGGTPGIWTPADGQFALDHGFDFPLAGACITQLGNLDCSAADTQACADAGGALCFHEVGPVGEALDELPLCWWAVDEAGCPETPGVWTTADSGFGQGHPKALPPSGAPSCILQVPFVKK